MVYMMNSIVEKGPMTQNSDEISAINNTEHEDNLLQKIDHSFCHCGDSEREKIQNRINTTKLPQSVQFMQPMHGSASSNTPWPEPSRSSTRSFLYVLQLQAFGMEMPVW